MAISGVTLFAFVGKLFMSHKYSWLYKYIGLQLGKVTTLQGRDVPKIQKRSKQKDQL